MDIAAWICVCMLACIGMGAMIGDLLFVRRSKKAVKSNFRVITLYDEPAQVEEVINSLLLRMTWSGPDGIIILVDMGMGEEALAVCEKMRSELYGAFMCMEPELPSTLRRLDTLYGSERKGKKI